MASITDILNSGVDTVQNAIQGGLDVVNGVIDAAGSIVGKTGNAGETTVQNSAATQAQVVSVTPWSKYAAIGLGGIVAILVLKKLLK